jgi:DNA-binding Xre family transcriptional regulator
MRNTEYLDLRNGGYLYEELMSYYFHLKSVEKRTVMPLANKLDKILKERDMTVSELARVSGLTKVTMYNTARKGIKLETALRISKVLNLSVEDIWEEVA